MNIEEIGDHLPVGLLINHKDGHNSYTNKASMELLNYTRDELDILGAKYQYDIWYDINDFKRINDQIMECYRRNDENEIFSYFQRLKPNGYTGYLWMYVASKILKNEEGSSEQRLLVACPVNQMGDMSHKVGRLLDENYYLKKYYKSFAKLTARERQILGMIAKGFSNPYISEVLFISRRTVEQHRKNVNKKLGSKTFMEVIKFAEVFDLV